MFKVGENSLEFQMFIQVQERTDFQNSSIDNTYSKPPSHRLHQCSPVFRHRVCFCQYTSVNHLYRPENKKLALHLMSRRKVYYVFIRQLRPRGSSDKILSKLFFVASLDMIMTLSFYIVLFDPSSHQHELSQEEVNL